MNRGDAARVLAKAAAFDSRTIGEADVAAWAEALDGLTLADALEAVTRHYRESRERLMPADVIAICADLSRERIADARRLEAERQRKQPAVGTTDRSAEIRARLREILPEGRPDKLRGPAWLANNPGLRPLSTRDGES